MFSRPAFFLFLSLLLPLQTPRDSIQLHHEKAEALRSARDLKGAETEYKVILGEAYRKLARVRSAQTNYAAAVTALEAALIYRPASDDLLIDLGIAYFHAQQYEKALSPLITATLQSPEILGLITCSGRPPLCWVISRRPQPNSRKR